jgi:hypothetical protein
VPLPVETEVNTAEPQSAGEGIGPKDAHLTYVIALLEENTHCAMEKAEQWRLEAEWQAKIFIDLGSNDKA